MPDEIKYPHVIDEIGEYARVIKLFNPDYFWTDCASVTVTTNLNFDHTIHVTYGSGGGVGKSNIETVEQRARAMLLACDIAGQLKTALEQGYDPMRFPISTRNTPYRHIIQGLEPAEMKIGDARGTTA